MVPEPAGESTPLRSALVARRADKAWKNAGVLADRIILHEGCHSAASA
jgi:hypothetical protein